MTIEEILKLRQEAGGLNKLMHMHVVTLDKDGGATVELDLTPELLNPLGMAHGGTIFTLCDIAAGSAAASQGTVAVTLDSTIHYYRPGRCGKKADRCGVRAQARPQGVGLHGRGARRRGQAYCRRDLHHVLHRRYAG